MTSPLLSLPVELMLRIVTSLLLGTGKIFKENYDDPHALSHDVELACTALVYLANLSMTCRAMWRFCTGVCRLVRLAGVGCHPAFLEVLENVIARSDGRKTRFLSLDNRAGCDGCERCSDYEQCGTILGRVFSHFSEITTLDLVNFPFTPNVTQCLSQLKALRILSIREPFDIEKFRYKPYSRDREFPRVTNLSIVVSDREESGSAVRTILALFIQDLVTVSIKTKRHPKGRKSDFATRLFFPGIWPHQKPNLRSLSIGYLECETYSLRSFLRACIPLDYLEIDCTGLRGLLPLRYIIDLLCQLTGARVGENRSYTYENVAMGMDVRAAGDAYSPGPKVWQRCVAGFACRFLVPESTQEGDIMIQKLKIIFASKDENSRTINEDMRLKELNSIFRKYAQWFAAIEVLLITMPEDTGFKSRESRKELIEILSNICLEWLPSVKKVGLAWGQFSFSLPLERQDSLATSHSTKPSVEA